jgi:transcription antitermination factor NusG
MNERIPLPEPEWFAIHTMSQQERLADRNLRRLGFWTFFPFDRVRKRRWNPGSRRFIIEWEPRPYFSRYIFVALRFADETTNVIQSESIDGVSTVVKRPLSGIPLRIPNTVMDLIMDRAMVRFDETGNWCAALMREIVVEPDKEVMMFVDVLGKRRMSSALAA